MCTDEDELSKTNVGMLDKRKFLAFYFPTTTTLQLSEYPRKAKRYATSDIKSFFVCSVEILCNEGTGMVRRGEAKLGNAG
jgi:hypothetical protein